MKKRILTLLLALCMTAAFIVPASADAGITGSWYFESDWGDITELSLSPHSNEFYWMVSDDHFLSVQDFYYVFEGTYKISGDSLVLSSAWIVWDQDGGFVKDPVEEIVDLTFILHGDSLTLTDDYGEASVFTKTDPFGLWNYGMSADIRLLNPEAPNLKTANYWAHTGINRAYSNGYLPDEILDNYKNIITRAEFCRLAVRWAEYSTLMSIDELLEARGLQRDPNAFTDTDDSDILAAYALGITSGTGGGLFDPNGQFNREQAATMIMNTCGAVGADINNYQPSGFADIGEAEAWAVQGIDFVRTHFIMFGTGGNNFSPKDLFTREQSIVTFNNISGLPRPPEPQSDVRHLLVKVIDEYEAEYEGTEPRTPEQALAGAEELLEMWLNGAADEDYFAELVYLYTDDIGSKYSGGLYTEITPTSGYMAAFRDWATDPSRQPGDTGIVEVDGWYHGFHIMYFVERRMP
jgi:hypothetical protein